MKLQSQNERKPQLSTLNSLFVSTINDDDDLVIVTLSCNSLYRSVYCGKLFYFSE